jgi:hypothetical protein
MVASTDTIHLNLGLRRFSTQTMRLMAEWTGLTVISTKTRNKILDSAPWLAAYFRLGERVKPPSESKSCAGDSYLRYDNPFLIDLRRRYADHPANDHIQWDTAAVEAQIDLTSVRADNLYLFQSRRYPPWAYYATAAYVTQIDRIGLWSTLCEDDHFGAEIFDFHGKIVSRDLLDSIIEINFLDRHIGLSKWRDLKVLDIGAGYGRLAHRMATALPNLYKYYCVDAVPESTFISDHYLKYRNVAGRCDVVPLDQLSRVEQPDLAINIHSFPECQNQVVEWWLHRVRDLSVPWLFIVCNPSFGLTSRDVTGRKDFRQLIERSGFELVAYESKFESAPILNEHGLYPADHYLFRRS